VKPISSLKANSSGMSNLRRYAVVLIILYMLSIIPAVCADPQYTDTPLPSVSAKASTTTAKATIAPIETREPSVKPPSTGGVTPSPSATPVRIPSAVPTTRTTVPTATQTESVISLDDTASARSYYQWGLAFASQGEHKAAISEFEKSLARDPQNVDAWYHFGLSAEALGYTEMANGAYTYILQTNPSFTPPKRDDESAIFAELKQNTTNVTPIPTITPPPNDIGIGIMVYLLIGAGMVLGVVLSAYYITHTAGHAPRKILAKEKIEEMADKTMEYFDGDRRVVVELLTIASEIAVEGREGKHVGTAFILGATDEVLDGSRPLILNPFEGHTEESRYILDSLVHENIKELAQMDGAFVIRDDGVAIAAGRYISIDTSSVRIPKGLGTRHVSVAAITKETSAVGIVVSESGGHVRVFAKGTIVAETA
jgi:DNA integrity scanning protein DisA with diadenylate cyclase activity